MATDPPTPSSASPPRSPTSLDDVPSAADATPRASHAHHLSTASSTTIISSASSATLTSPVTPPSHPEKPSASSKAPTVSRRRRFRARLFAAFCLPISGSAESEAEGASGPSAVEAERRVLQLKHDAVVANAAAPPRSTAGLFKEACSTDLLFLIDTTGSMGSYIEAAKNQVRSIMDDIKVAFFNEADVRIAVVGYKDHGDKPNIQFLDFTPDADPVRSFLKELTATGGADTPEDVLGGIRQALNATWKHHTRCIIHIADAPPHGRTLHNMKESCDNYATPGSEPHHLLHEPLLKQMVGLNINYAFLRIHDTTDRMAFTFLQAYSRISPECRLHSSNIYFSKACEMNASFRGRYRGGDTSKRSAKAALRFEELELGTTYSALRHLVVQSVTTSASRTAGRVSAGSGPKAERLRSVDLQLTAIKEDEDDVDAKLETTPPKWNKPAWFDETLMVEAFTTDVGMHGAVTLDDMMAYDDIIQISTTDLTIHKRSRPFAQGAMRVAAYARTAASTNRLVVKSFKRGGKELAHLADDMRCQALCKAFALEFNALSEEKHSIDFIVATCLKPKSGPASSNKCMSLEPFIEGTYVKYNSNSGYVNEDAPFDAANQAAQAFSHFTFERSRGRFLICDLQGVGRVLTDPVIHTLDPERFKLADTNLGEAGFKFFFGTHKCNTVCHKLELKSNSSMIRSGDYEFRETWPGIGEVTSMMVCCSNKLCSTIVRVATAKKSNEFPGYYWCDACWPQLHRSMISVICVASVPHHEFDLSKFFYESQGQIMPRMCPEHRASAVSLSKRPVGEMRARGRDGGPGGDGGSGVCSSSG